ncbi:alpha/beta hydrolase fold domain-containing protein [Microbacterium sp. NPDC055683]
MSALERAGEVQRRAHRVSRPHHASLRTGDRHSGSSVACNHAVARATVSPPLPSPVEWSRRDVAVRRPLAALAPGQSSRRCVRRTGLARRACGAARGDASLPAIAGDSAGANIAVCAALRARDANGPDLVAQWLMYATLAIGWTRHHGDCSATLTSLPGA